MLIYPLFNDALRHPDHTTCKDWTVSKQRIWKELVGSSRGLNLIYSSGICLEGPRETIKNSVMIVECSARDSKLGPFKYKREYS
jgi:hypothetical protein